MKTSHLVSALPLCCLFLAAANQNDCNINITVHDDDHGHHHQGEGEGETGEGEGEGQQGDCQSDADCGPGLICQFDCPPCAQPDPTDPNAPVCEIACPAEGKCVAPPPPPPPCTSDADCGDGFFCAFECAQPGTGNGSDQPIACNTGVCQPVPPPPPPGDCSTDSDCGPGSVCETVCTGSDGGGSGGNGAPPPPTDPNGGCQTMCVEVDPCFGQCDPSTSFCTILADGSPTCEPYGPSCMSDSDCQNGQVCDTTTNCAPDPSCGPNDNCAAVCTGVCVDPPPPSCTSDADCASGQVCLQECPATPIACQPDPNGNCLPPPPCTGICVVQDPPPPAQCNADSDCPAGDKCVQTEQCAPCDPTTGQACSDVCQLVSVCLSPDGTPPTP